MRNLRTFALTILASLALAGLWSVAVGQTNESNLANVTAGGSTIRWDVTAPNAGCTLTITAPDGRSFTKEYKSGATPEFTFSERQGLPDGSYGYELKLQPVLTPGQKEEMKRLRGKDDDPEAERAGRRRPNVPVLVQNGSCGLLHGQVIVAGRSEDNRAAKVNVKPSRAGTVISGNTLTRLRNHRVSLGVLPDQVIPDDLIVQASLCVGFDCVNNENFGFDTIRLKENNLRIHFDDTSTSAGFPANDWRIIANDSASGGQSKFSIEDSTGGRTPFTIEAGSTTNSIYVDSTGKVGFRTSTPVLDLHVNTGDTPATRLEQNSGGGFGAQTWDIAGNEANFFVRDVTSGSRLPFRIRPGAPTSSIDISANGDVGIGKATPTVKLDINGHVSLPSGFNLTWGGPHGSNIPTITAGSGAASFVAFYPGGTTSGETMRITSSGSVGIGTNAPDQLLSVNGNASKLGGGSWQSFSDERLKTLKGKFNSGLKAVMQLSPIRYEYLKNNALGLKSNGEYIGIGAQALQKVIPEAVTTNSEGYLMVNNDPIIWTMLNAIKEQQKEIEHLKSEVRKLRSASQRRRK